MNERARFEVAQILLTAPSFTGRMNAFVRPATGDAEAERGGTIIWDDVRELARTCSTGEKILIELAWQLYSGKRDSLLENAKGPNLADLIAYVDAQHVMYVSQALQIAAIGLAE